MTVSSSHAAIAEQMEKCQEIPAEQAAHSSPLRERVRQNRHTANGCVSTRPFPYNQTTLLHATGCAWSPRHSRGDFSSYTALTPGRRERAHEDRSFPRKG